MNSQVDHQMPFYTSPGYDLNYFMITSPDLQTRLEHEKDLLRIYKEAFNAKLQDLSCDQHILTDDRLRIIYKQKSIYGFTMMLTIMPLIMRTVSEGVQTEDKNETIDRSMNALFANEDFVAILKYSLRKFMKMGTFDELVNWGALQGGY